MSHEEKNTMWSGSNKKNEMYITSIPYPNKKATTMAFTLLQSLKTTSFITHKVHLQVASNMENFYSSYKFYGLKEVGA